MGFIGEAHTEMHNRNVPKVHSDVRIITKSVLESLLCAKT